jgi:hypothetical protein
MGASVNRRAGAIIGVWVLVMGLGIAGCQQTLPYDYQRVEPELGVAGFLTEHYLIFSQMSNEATYDLAWRLESLYDYYAERFADEYDPIDFSLKVFLFDNQEDVVAAGGHAFMPGGFMTINDEVGPRVAMRTHDNDWEGLVQYSGALLYHEAFHQFLALEISQAGNTNRRWPTWANEGHGTVFNNLIWTGDGWVDGAIRPKYIGSAVENREGFIPLEQLLTIDGAGWHALLAEGKVWAVYMESMSLLHFMYYEQDGIHRELIEDYVAAISRRARGEEAADLAQEIIALEPEFLAWFDANMVLPDGEPNLDLSYDKMFEAFTAMVTSHLARAHARGQRFERPSDFLRHAEEGTLDIAPRGDSQWLPDTLREEMVWRYAQLVRGHAPLFTEIDYPEDGLPVFYVRRSRVTDYLKGTFVLDVDGTVRDVTVEWVRGSTDELPDSSETSD